MFMVNGTIISHRVTPSMGSIQSEILTLYTPEITLRQKRIPVSSFLSRFSLISLVSEYEGQSFQVIFIPGERISTAVMPYMPGHMYKGSLASILLPYQSHSSYI